MSTIDFETVRKNLRKMFIASEETWLFAAQARFFPIGKSFGLFSLPRLGSSSKPTLRFAGEYFIILNEYKDNYQVNFFHKGKIYWLDLGDGMWIKKKEKNFNVFGVLLNYLDKLLEVTHLENNF